MVGKFSLMVKMFRLNRWWLVLNVVFVFLKMMGVIGVMLFRVLKFRWFSLVLKKWVLFYSCFIKLGLCCILLRVVVSVFIIVGGCVVEKR